MTETQLKEKVQAYCKSLGLFCIKIAGGPRQRTGISDLLIVLPPRGRLLAMELKAPGKLNEITPIQQNFLKHVDTVGGVAVGVDTLEMARSFIDRCVMREHQDAIA